MQTPTQRQIEEMNSRIDNLSVLIREMRADHFELRRIVNCMRLKEAGRQ